MTTLNVLVAGGLGMLVLGLILWLIPTSASGAGYNSPLAHSSSQAKKITKSLTVKALLLTGLPLAALGFFADEFVRANQSAFAGTLVLPVFSIIWFVEWRTRQLL